MLFFFCYTNNLIAVTDEWTMFKNDVVHSSVSPADLLTYPFSLKWNTASFGVTCARRSKSVTVGGPKV
jgi:hypothetical protein